MFVADDVDIGDLSDKAPENPCLIENDIDLYRGMWGEEQLTIHFKEMKYHKVAGVGLDVNTIPCSGLSTTSLLQNNDVNETAVCFEVMSTGTNLDISVICAPAYWQFLLTEKHVVRPVLTSDFGAKIFFLIAYKLYQMDLPFYMCGVKTYTGKIATSHNYKLEGVQSDRDHHFFWNLRVKKQVVVATKFSVNLQKLVVQHASMEKQMKSFLGSGVLYVSEKKMLLSARSTRTTHHIRVNQQQFQRNNIVVNCFSV